MNLTESQSMHVLLYEGEGSIPLGEDLRFELIALLLENGFSITCTKQDQTMDLDLHDFILMIGKFHENSNLSNYFSKIKSNFSFANIASQSPEAVLKMVCEKRNRLGAFEHGKWKPWFPVIDYDRCTNCMQCLSFCLFGVYGVDEDNRLQVQNQDSCKTNCPACSRVCPEAAIMFPKYRSGPINGDQVSAADLKREKMKVDISSLLGGDIYQMLRDRSEKARSRFSKERSPDKALGERKKCLTKLAASGDIPEEVLMSLPAPDEIVRRAEEATAKANAARAKIKES